MIPPLTRTSDSRPPIDASLADVPEFDRLPPFLSRRSGAAKPDPERKPNEFGGDWSDFADDGRRVPAIGFWLVFIGGTAVGFIGACALAWSVLA
jgi:hypothetical protein